LRSVFSLNDVGVDNDEAMVVMGGPEDVGDTFKRLGSGLGTLILSASDLDNKNGLLVL